MTATIKVLHVVPAIFEGGVGSVVNNYYEKIDKSKFQFDVITHLKENNDHNKLFTSSKIIYFNTLGKIGIYKYYKQIKSTICFLEYDIIHIHVGHVTGLYALIYKICGAKRIISHAHTTIAPNPKHNRLMPLLRVLTRLFSDKLCSCGKLAGDFCFGHVDYEIIKNGIDYNRYLNIKKSDISKLKRDLQIKSCEFTLGNVAAFSDNKNHKFLLQIFLELSQVRDNIKLVLVGEGPLKKQCIEFVKKNNLTEKVLFLGQRADVYHLMKVFDVHILVSFFEGLPVTGIEAQAAGIQCVFSDTIDNQVDLGIGLAKFLPIIDGTLPWVNYLKNLDLVNKDEHILRDALIAEGYEINHSIKKLENMYLKLINDKI